MDCDSHFIYDRQGSSRDTCVGAYACQWRALSGSFQGVFLNMLDLDMLFVCHATEVEYVRHMREMLRTDISSKSGVVNLSRSCLHHPFRSFYLIGKANTWGRDLNLEERQRSKELLVGWHSIELLAVPPARRGLVHQQP